MNIPLDTITILIIILAITVLVLACMVYSLNSKLKKFLIGSSSGNLDESLLSLNSSIKGLESFKKELETYLVSVEMRLKKSVQGVHTVRFNPFKGSTGSGGNQSFATAFVNEQGDGVVISSLYARDHVSIFAKPVIKGRSEFEVSEEEGRAIAEAHRMVK